MGKILFSASVYLHLAAFHKPFIKLLQSKGYEVHAAANPDHGRKEEIEEMGVICWDIPFPRFPFRVNQNLHSIKALKRLFIENKYDLIHVHTPVAAFLVRYLGKKYKQPNILYTAHGFHFYNGGGKINNFIYYNVEKIASKWTDGLIVINKEDFQSAQKMSFVENKNVFFVHGVGVDIEQYKAPPTKSIKNELGISEDDIVITSVAELNENKNHMFLLNNWKEILKVHAGCHFLIVGTGIGEESLESFVKDQQLKNVHFLGFRTDVPDILKSSDIVTLLSKREGLPRCIMEAMACGKPAVVTNIRGSRDLIEHGKNGFVVELGNNEDLIKYMIDLLKNPNLRGQMGAISLEKIKDYSLNHVLEEIDIIYNNYLK